MVCAQNGEDRGDVEQKGRVISCEFMFLAERFAFSLAQGGITFF